MPKPIFTIGLPDFYCEEETRKIIDSLSKQLKDDYYIVFYQVPDKHAKFEMFSEHTIPKQDFNKLFSCIEEQMKKHKLNFLHSLNDEYS